MNNINNWQVRIINSPCKLARDIYIWRSVGENRIEVLGWDNKGNQIATVKDSNSAEYTSPSISLDPETLQCFADALNETGIKPQKGFLEGKLEATDKHLEDMRKLVFNKTE